MEVTYMYDKAIKVVYKDFSNIEGREQKPVTSFTFKCPVEFENLSDYQICEKVFEITNLKQGKVWDSIQNNLPQERTHTSLSVGDEVVIQVGRTKEWVYTCEDLGFTLQSVEWSLV